MEKLLILYYSALLLFLINWPNLTPKFGFSSIESMLENSPKSLLKTKS